MESYLFILNVLFNVIMTSALIIILVINRKFIKNLTATLNELFSYSDVFTSSLLSDKVPNQYLEFDERVETMRNELKEIYNKSNPATELHPLVKNLPHSIIDDKYNLLPDVEVAE